MQNGCFQIVVRLDRVYPFESKKINPSVAKRFKRVQKTQNKRKCGQPAS
jgi:hypothetical protein